MRYGVFLWFLDCQSKKTPVRETRGLVDSNPLEAQELLFSLY